MTTELYKKVYDLMHDLEQHGHPCECLDCEEKWDDFRQIREEVLSQHKEKCDTLQEYLDKVSLIRERGNPHHADRQAEDRPENLLIADVLEFLLDNVEWQDRPEHGMTATD